MIDMRVASLTEVPGLQSMDLATNAQYVEWGYPEAHDSDSIPDGVAADAIKDQRLFVAAIPGSPAIVGWLYVTRSEFELCLGQIIVDTAHQQRGIGSAMMGWLFERSMVAGEASIVLSTQTDVPWNQPWYESIGFEVLPEADWTPHMFLIREMQTKEGVSWANRVHMRRCLST